MRGGERFQQMSGGSGFQSSNQSSDQNHNHQIDSPSHSRGGSQRGGDRYAMSAQQQPLQPLQKHSGGVSVVGKRKKSSTLGFILLLVFVALLAPIVYHQQHKHHPIVHHQREREQVVFRDIPGYRSGDVGNIPGDIPTETFTGGWGSGVGGEGRADARRTGDPFVALM